MAVNILKNYAVELTEDLEGYWFTNEHNHRVTVMGVIDNWCMVQDDNKKDPYVLPLEFVLAIKEASDEERATTEI